MPRRSRSSATRRPAVWARASGRGRGRGGRRVDGAVDDAGEGAPRARRRRFTDDEIINWSSSDDDGDDDDGDARGGRGGRGGRARGGRGRGRVSDVARREGDGDEGEVMMVGGVRVVVDRGGGSTERDAFGASFAYDYADEGMMRNERVTRGVAEASSTDEEDTDEEDWLSEDEDERAFVSDSDVDLDIAMDYAENARLRLDEFSDSSDGSMDESEDGEDDDDDDDDDDEEEDDDDDANWALRELRLISNMNVDGNGRREPGMVSFSSEDEDAHHRGLGMSRGEVAKMKEAYVVDAAPDAAERMVEKWSSAISAAISAGVAYVGFSPAASSAHRKYQMTTSPPLEVINVLAKAHRCSLEIRGGGKRRHAVVHCERGSRVTPNGFDYAKAENTLRKTFDKDVKPGRQRPPNKRERRMKSAVTFVSGGVAGEEPPTISNSDNGDDDDDAAGGDANDNDAPAAPVVYANRGSRRAAEAQARDREYVEKMRAKKRGIVVGGGHKFGAFEAHTTGFGSKMLAKMGFQGEGSGVGTPGREGISEPVLAMTRGKRVGLGALGSERG